LGERKRKKGKERKGKKKGDIHAMDFAQKNGKKGEPKDKIKKNNGMKPQEKEKMICREGY
jgi:hypothetical protein